MVVWRDLRNLMACTGTAVARTAVGRLARGTATRLIPSLSGLILQPGLMAIDGSPAAVHACGPKRLGLSGRRAISDTFSSSSSSTVTAFNPIRASSDIRPLSLPSLPALNAPVVCHFSVTRSAFSLPSVEWWNAALMMERMMMESKLFVCWRTTHNIVSRY